MKSLTIENCNSISGGTNAEVCQSRIEAGGGLGGLLGSAGGFIGGLVGALVGGAIAARVTPECKNPGPEGGRGSPGDGTVPGDAGAGCNIGGMLKIVDPWEDTFTV